LKEGAFFMRTTDKFVFFWNGIFSQWHPSVFRDEHDNEYNCAEQYMMAEKARLFNDTATLDLIMGIERDAIGAIVNRRKTTPKEQKALGRKVANFDPKIWDDVCLPVVVKGNTFKFEQNADMREFLLKTGKLILVEASPYDTIWGIGMAENDFGVEDPANWKGKNLLGEALMQVRAKMEELDALPKVPVA
jgi:ribA/ribD-fused uncharacterized protein